MCRSNENSKCLSHTTRYVHDTYIQHQKSVSLSQPVEEKWWETSPTPLPQVLYTPSPQLWKWRLTWCWGLVRRLESTGLPLGAADRHSHDIRRHSQAPPSSAGLQHPTISSHTYICIICVFLTLSLRIPRIMSMTVSFCSKE